MKNYRTKNAKAGVDNYERQEPTGKVFLSLERVIDRAWTVWHDYLVHKMKRRHSG